MNSNFIWSKEQCIDAYDDLMIRIAMSSYAAIDGEALLAENEHLKILPKFQAASKIKGKIHQMEKREHLRRAVNRLGGRLYSVASKVALIFLVCAITFAMTISVSADFRAAIYRFIFTHEKEYTLIELDRSGLEFVDSEIYTWDHAFAPTVMLPGYQVKEVVNLVGLNHIIYEDDVGGYIHFLQSGNNPTLQVDTENVQLVQTVLINDSEGLLVNKNGVHTLTWHIGNTLLHLESNEDNEALVSIAKGIKLLR